MNWSDSFVPYGGGKKAAVGGLADSRLLERLRNYKRQIAKRYRVLDPARMEGQLPKGDLWISPKLDGELWFLVKQDGDLALCAVNGRVLHGIPLLQNLARQAAAAPDFLVAGELVAPIGSGRPRSHHLASALADDQYAANLAFHAFDLVSENHDDVGGTPYGQRLARLQEWFGADATIATVVGDAGEVGLTQITSRVQFDEEIEVPASSAGGNAIVLDRKVWTKETKGLVAVRKYVLIQTNQPVADYPPLVLFATDYSPGRADPLQTTLRTADTLTTADKLVAGWIEENIKKGWNPATA